jgi:hypothetical protein
VTLPKSDAQSSRLLPRRQHMVSFTHSMSPSPFATPFPSAPLAPSSFPGSVAPSTELAEKMAHEHALDFATHSWDLATGGLKTLTAKRELPPRIERRIMETMADTPPPSRSYALLLAILVSIMLMLIGGGVILFVMLQP